MRAPRLVCFVSVLAIGAWGCSSKETGAADSTTSAVSGVPIGDIRGVVDVSNTLKARIFDDQDPMSAQFDVSRVAGPVFRLRKQLGVFAPEGTISTYQGGTPTPLRMTLWHQIFTRFATAVAGLCTTPGTAVTFATYAKGPSGSTTQAATFRVNASFAQNVANACAFGGGAPARRDTAGELWDAVMGIGGTLAADRSSFVSAFADDGAPSVDAAPADRVANMMQAMLLNPHFLLAK